MDVDPTQSNHAPIDHHELQERIGRLFDESDRVIAAILSKYIDDLHAKEQ